LRRRMSSSDLPENMGPVMTSIRPGTGRVICAEPLLGVSGYPKRRRKSVAVDFVGGFFLELVDCGFCRGFCEKSGANCGEFVVNCVVNVVVERRVFRLRKM
jgi:hypothetical protein